MKVSFFGYRDAPWELKEKLCKAVEKLIREGGDTFFIGKQGSFDCMAQAVLAQLKERYPHIHVILVLAYMPKPGDPAQEQWETLYPDDMEKAPLRYAIDRRNRWMVENSDMVVTYVVRTWGGAAKAKRLAEKKKKRIYVVE